MLRRTIEALNHGTTTARALIENCLDAIDRNAPAVFLKVHAASARAEAEDIDRRRKAGEPLPPLAGIPISVKDLFDIRGDITTAGSEILRTAPPAEADAPAVARLRAAGCIIVGRTNMTEFAYSGLGLNPHYGTPRNPYERAVGRIPGGSSSGAAVAIADGMAAGSLGTDTGGSCRIPAALCGVVGFKPTASRVPRDGAYPLSKTLDSVGPLANTVEDCALFDAVLAGGPVAAEVPAEMRTLRLRVPTTLVLDSLDEHVARDFERRLKQLSKLGAKLDESPLSAFGLLPQLNSRGGIAAYEAYGWHRALLEAHAAEYDRRVATRILKGKDITDAQHQELLQERSRMIDEVARLSADYDALVMPTVPIIAPRLDEFETDERYVALNGQVLRNASIANFLDRCAISVPMHQAGSAPTGLMLIGEHNGDRRLLAVAAAIESALTG